MAAFSMRRALSDDRTAVAFTLAGPRTVSAKTGEAEASGAFTDHAPPMSIFVYSTYGLNADDPGIIDE
jgi:hypothetical protein